MILFRRTAASFAALAAAGALAACDSEPEVEPVNTDYGMTADTNTYVAVPVPVDTMEVELSPEQQQRRDQLDQTSYYSDVRTLEDDYLAEVEADPMTGENAAGGGMSADNSMAGSIDSSAGSGTMSGNMSGSMSGSAGGTRRVDTGRMSFEDLDRNDDGKLSVAEFAVYAVGLDPDAPKPNDERMPYARSEQLNRAADGFYYYDTSGDTYLQPDEFAAARAGGTAS